MVRRRLGLVLVRLSPCALERQERSTELLQIRQLLFRPSCKCCFGGFVCGYRLVQDGNKSSKLREEPTWSPIYVEL